MVGGLASLIANRLDTGPAEEHHWPKLVVRDIPAPPGAGGNSAA